jgi:hypothetical protein
MGLAQVLTWMKRNQENLRKPQRSTGGVYKLLKRWYFLKILWPGTLLRSQIITNKAL